MIDWLIDLMDYWVRTKTCETGQCFWLIWWWAAKEFHWDCAASSPAHALHLRISVHLWAVPITECISDGQEEDYWAPLDIFWWVVWEEFCLWIIRLDVEIGFRRKRKTKWTMSILGQEIPRCLYPQAKLFSKKAEIELVTPTDWINWW